MKQAIKVRGIVVKQGSRFVRIAFAGPRGPAGTGGGGGGSNIAADISFVPAGTIAATNVQAAIAEVASERVTADTSLATSITAEASSRTAADASLATALSAEVSLTASRDTSLATAISSGDTSLTAALGTAISSEAGTRSTADSSLATRISTLEGAGGGDVSIEASVRASADTSLTTRLGNEESARGTGDSSLTTRVSAEESTRTAADSSLTTRLGTEESTRGTADSSLTTRISTEESVRASADTSLTTAVGTKLTSNTEIAALASALSSGTGYPHRTGANTYVMDTPSGGGGMSNPMTTAGDLILGGTAGAAGRLAIGTAARVLTSDGTTAAWANAVGREIFQASSPQAGADGQSIPASTWTKITSAELSVEDYDLHGWWDAANARLTPTVACTLLVYGGAVFSAVDTGARWIVSPVKNGAVPNTVGIFARGVGAGAGVLIGASGAVRVTFNGTTDYVELWVYHSSAAAAYVYRGAEFQRIGAILIKQ